MADDTSSSSFLRRHPFWWFVIASAGLAGSLDPRALRPYFGESHTRIRQTVVGIRFERGKRPGPVGDAGIYHYLMLAVW